MEGLKPPRPLEMDGNLAENWKAWKQQFHFYFTACGGKSKEDDIKVALLLHTIGAAALEKFNTFSMSAEDCKDMNKILDAFEQYCVPRANETVNRHIFFARSQLPDETFDSFLSDLKKLSSTCAFGDLRDGLIRDRIIGGIRDKTLMDRLLRDAQLNLDKCITLCKASELANQQMRLIDTKQEIHEVKSYQNVKPMDYAARIKGKIQSANMNSQADNRRLCTYCGKGHPKYRCPAYGKNCTQCGRLNHFASVCRAGKVNVVDEQVSSASEESYVLGTVMVNNVDRSAYGGKDWYITLKLSNDKILNAKLDTGAQCNVMPMNKFEMLGLPRNMIKRSMTKLQNYNGSEIKVAGRCELTCEMKNGVKHLLVFHVVLGAESTPIVLGLRSIEIMNLIKRVDIVKEITSLSGISDRYKNLFTGMGHIKGFVYDIKLQDGVPGTVEPCRKVPLRIQKFLEGELKRMELNGIIEKITEPTEWVNSLVIVKKSDSSLRVCLDPQNLNKAILREHYTLPTIEEISSSIGGAKYYSILDANKAFWQVELSPESTKFTTFNTPFGRYCFRRMPYGISSAPEVFHRCFVEMFSGIPGVQIYIDDILIFAESVEEHNRRLEMVLERARERGVRFNAEKCQFGLQEVKYLGHRFSEHGIRPAEDRIEAIQAINQPQNKKELQTFLGMITYVSRFIPNVSQVTSALRHLLRNDTVWVWGPQQTQAFKNLQDALTNAPVLQYYDDKKPLVLSVDASQDGVGAVLLQGGLPVAYASKALTDVQKGYAQIEKETHAIVFGCERFHQYIYGRPIVVQTDHKPLEFIFGKPLNKCPARLQRMRIRLQQYDLTVKYTPGKFLYIADALSRAYINETDASCDEDVEAHVALVMEGMPVTKDILERFKQETKKDEELQMVMHQLRGHWPEKQRLNDLIKPYHSYRCELNIMDDLLFKNDCIVVPRSLRKEMIEKIHYNHMGIDKCKLRAREILFWPHMLKQIENTIENCETCLRFQRKNSKQCMIPREIPLGPWQAVGTDLFYYKGKDFLIVVDYFSKYVEIEGMKSLGSEETIELLKKVFARHGKPQIVFSDNGPQFSSYAFKQFARSWDFKHKTSSPQFPQSNGLVERYIQTVKRLWRKAEYDGKDPYMAILEYRNMPITDEIKSPAEILFGRQLIGLLPTKEMLQPNKQNGLVREQLKHRQMNQQKFYNRNTKHLSPLEIGDNVFFQPKDGEDCCLSKGQVISVNERPRSYKLLTENNTIIDRNRKDLSLGSNQQTMQIQPSMVQVEDDDDVEVLCKKGNDDPYHEEPGREAIVVTRAGRVSKPPGYLNDYLP